MSTQDIERRLDTWLKLTGLKQSKAIPSRVLPWLPDYRLPSGFDHTRVLYYPPEKVHVLLTEPYHSVTAARESMTQMRDAALLSRRVRVPPASMVFGNRSMDRGIWYPGSCAPMLVGPERIHTLMLEWYAALPKVLIGHGVTYLHYRVK